MGTHFEKVSYAQFIKDCKEWEDNPRVLETIYDNIKIPKRATLGSAGYDFFAPYDITIKAHDSVVIPSGIRWVVPRTNQSSRVVLTLYPRSGHGFKHGIRLSNTCGIIDSDYYESDNEGHIMVKLYNPSDNDVIINEGKGFCQGIITKYLVMDDDETTSNRNGGFGSTDR